LHIDQRLVLSQTNFLIRINQIIVNMLPNPNFQETKIDPDNNQYRMEYGLNSLTSMSIKISIFRVSLPLLLVFYCSFLESCKKNDQAPPSEHINKYNDISDPAIAIQWADMTLYTFRHGKNTPTYSSRSLGYLGLTMYESIVYADDSHRSMSGQLNGLTDLPLYDKNSDYKWQLVLNSSMRTMLKLLYPSTNNIKPEDELKIDSFYDHNLTEYSAGVDLASVERSVEYGNKLANAIFNWSKTDGGYEAYLKPFDSTFSFPSGPSYWVPPKKGQTVSKYPLHPHWGTNRTFSADNGTLPVPGIIPYSTDPQSDYYKIYNDIYELNKNLTRTEKEIAQWWADDPTETVSPPGHSFNLASIAIRKAQPNLLKAAETYARVGMAVADAFICCFKTKYTYFNERPSTYINNVIDVTWSPWWPEPPFPAFSSGHSTQSSAAATVLTSLYGDNFSFTDDTHAGAVRFPFAEPMQSRNYTSFFQCAEETGYSRLIGGIHTSQDNETGLSEGKKIGNNINNMLWER